MKPYPALICHDCGIALGNRIPECATWHYSHCGWCEQFVAVTESRDYGYPAAPKPPKKEK